MIIHDLNELSNAQEKYAKVLENSTKFNKFDNILNENNLIDIGNIGLLYTR